MQNERHSRVWIEAVAPEETRAAGADGRTLQLRGYAILWNSESEVMGSFIETIDPRALDHLGDLNALDVRMQCDHEGKAVARTTNGTLRLSKDDRGIPFEANLDGRRADAKDLYYAVERGDMTNMSFGFIVDAEDVDEDKTPVRVHITKIKRLLEISPVNYPAYPDTTVEAVPMDDDVVDAECAPEDDEARAWEAGIMRKRLNLEW